MELLDIVKQEPSYCVPDDSALHITQPKASAEEVLAIILEGRSLDEAETETE